ncbi:NADPH-dependent FMN reductase [Notoacmeibacter sp. MSK16QG-6]|uniref:NADPH-dependent FMN reductase n=1 Tax=Notoacmeibacter sp. MSK16QG-6 TaxID=2957982 RepID=UPI00209DA524|nr:NADPH-dependent FMN reductase [Notoacmeibacter sp. MSK16QG-6]MCP1199998.1 NAD(P)H-dependent oxidoreductase [Notoacmeibacter sp. MSK16QG-6]
MKILAISGSARQASTNAAMLHVFQQMAPSGIVMDLLPPVNLLPVFSPDTEGENTPPEIEALLAAIDESDGLIFASPEYVRAIPGGLKNLIDWLVSRDAIIDKPIAIAHASHRGDDMLDSLRTVLATVSASFSSEIFVRFALMAKTPDEISQILRQPENSAKIEAFLSAFKAHCVSISNSR